MQGKHGGDVSKDQALEWLADALRIAGKTAAKYNVPFIYEPLNRYETNLINRLTDGADFIEANSLENIVLLADLFHMNIEETDLAASIRAAGKHVGHVHYADSNRRAMGLGHTDPAPIVAALKEINYSGHLSAEILPLPDPLTAALSNEEISGDPDKLRQTTNAVEKVSKTLELAYTRWSSLTEEIEQVKAKHGL